jgi:hypothetical protein
MADTTDIEKKSLEAHVELCAERYRFLEHKLEEVEEKINALEIIIKQVHDTVVDISNRHSDRLIQWGIGVITLLTATVGYLLATYVIK